MGPAESQLRERQRGVLGEAGHPASQVAGNLAAEAGRLDDEEVLADLSHELRNQFHKLYYCAELLRSPDGPPSEGDTQPAELLERTVQSLETFLAGALDYFRPLRLETIRMNGADVGRALDAILRGAADGARVEVAVASGADAVEVSVDPGRLSAALHAIAARLAAEGRAASQAFGIDARLCRARRTQGEVVEISIEIPASLGTAIRGRGRVVEWAMAAKVFAAHGGGLERAAETREVLGCTVWLPLVGGDWARRG